MSSQNPVVVNTPPTSFPITLIKQVEFKVNNIEDYMYLTSTDTENWIIADIREFAASVDIDIVSVDGVKVE